MLKRKSFISIIILNVFFVSQFIFGVNNIYASDINNSRVGSMRSSNPTGVSDPTVVSSAYGGKEQTALHNAVQKTVNVKTDYKAKGDGVTDDTNAFKSAIATGLPVYIPSGTFLISDTLQLKNSIKFDGKIKMKDYRKTCLEIKGKAGLSIENPNIDGGWGATGCPINFGDPNFYAGESGYAISIISSGNITVLGGNLKNTGGSGIFLGIDTKVSANAWNYSPNNIIVDGTVIENANHTIIGIEAGSNCTFRNITGYKHNNFIAGIDIEPNSKTPKATINNLLFDNCYIVSDGSSAGDKTITQYKLTLEGKAEPFQIDCVSVNVPHSWGTITVKNSTFIAKNCFAARCLGESSLKHFTNVLTFENCRFESNYGGFELWGRSNIDVKNCDIVLSKDAYKESTILSKADAKGEYNCYATVDNLDYQSEGIGELYIYQIGVVKITNSNIPKLSTNKCRFVSYTP